MYIEMLNSKIHRATVTDANINYVGSITIGEELMKAANIYEYQKVLVADIENGQRFETYVIKGEKRGDICINGAAARLASVGDKVIIMSYKLIEEKNASTHEPIVVQVDADNNII